MLAPPEGTEWLSETGKLSHGGQRQDELYGSPSPAQNRSWVIDEEAEGSTASESFYGESDNPFDSVASYIGPRGSATGGHGGGVGMAM